MDPIINPFSPATAPNASPHKIPGAESPRRVGF